MAPACAPSTPNRNTEWVTHEAVITKDETAFAIMGHRPIPAVAKDVAPGTPVSGANPGQEAAWGPSGTREKPTGLAIVNHRTREMTIVGQTSSGSGLWHVSGSAGMAAGPWATISPATSTSSTDTPARCACSPPATKPPPPTTRTPP